MRRWVALAALVALLLGVGWWFFFISPRNAQIAQAHTDLDAARQQQTVLETQIRQLQAIRDAEVEYLAGIGKMEGLIPERPLLDEFIEQIYQLSTSTGVDLLNLAPALPVVMTGSELRQITVAVTIDGEFFEILGFMFGVMDMDRLVRVDAITVASSQDESGNTTLSVSLGLRLFTLADLVPVSTTTTTVPADGGAPSDGGNGEASPAQTVATSTTTATTTPAGQG